MNDYLGFLLVSFLMAASPGPSWVYTISSTINNTWGKGLVANFGNSSGILVHATLSTCGLSAIILSSQIAFKVVQVFGGLYLAWLGVKTLTQSKSFETVSRDVRPSKQIFYEGVLVNVLNPKMFLLFFTLMPQFLSEAELAAPLKPLVIMGLTHALMAFFVHFALITCTDFFREKLRRPSRFVSYGLGALFLFYAFRVIWEIFVA